MGEQVVGRHSQTHVAVLKQFCQSISGVYAGSTGLVEAVNSPVETTLETKKILHTQTLDNIHCRQHC